jgi:hypothetical protein
MHKRRKFSFIERDFVAVRANNCCEYCQIPRDFSSETFAIEHIISLFHGGSNELTNLALSCGGCNSNKSYKISTLDPNTLKEIYLFNPRVDNWHEHFEWKDNFSFVEGVTPCGKATVELLKLNRKGVVNLRKALFVYGVHPQR